MAAAPGTKPPAAGKGRPQGSLNKTTQLLKDAILKAATDAGDGDMAVYLERQARDNPGPFMALLGKVLPLQVNANVTNMSHEAALEQLIGTGTGDQDSAADGLSALREPLSKHTH